MSACAGYRVYLFQGPRMGPHNLNSTGPHFSLIRLYTHSVPTYTSDIRFTTRMVRLNNFSDMYMKQAYNYNTCLSISHISIKR